MAKEVFRYPDLGGSTQRVALGVNRNQTTIPELFPHRALSATHSFQETEGQPLSLRRARMLERILRDHPVLIQPGELIVGTKTLKPRGSPVFPEINCGWVERDLETMATRSNTPFFVSKETKRVLRREVFPYWRGRQINDRITEAVPPEIWHAEASGVIYNYFTSRTIGHFAADYAKVLNRGMRGILDDVKTALSRLNFEDPRYIHKRQFLESLALVCAAAVDFAGRHALELRRLAREEKGAQRRSELKTMASVCERVPENPARSFQEALQSFWFTHLILNLETPAHSISPGRFDQYLYPFLRRGLESGEMDLRRAQELLDLLWVKFDEITLAKNSGESDTSRLLSGFSTTQYRRADAGRLGCDERPFLHVPDGPRAHETSSASALSPGQHQDSS